MRCLSTDSDQRNGTVAEALVDIFTVGWEEILSDMGAQFVSECMKEVSRLLLHSTNYDHTIPSNVQWIG